MAGFGLAYALLHGALLQLPGSAAESWLVAGLTVAPSATWIGWLRPGDGVAAQGLRLVWPEGRIMLRQGCDGFDVMALFAAAMLMLPVRWPWRLAWLGLGLVLLWSINQARIVALYLALREAPGWFDPIHSLWGPLALIGAAATLVVAAARWPPRSAA